MFSHGSVLVAGIDQEEVMVLALIVTGGVIWLLVHNIRKAYETRQREVTRRDVAAYVAEGSIRPQDAALILNAGSNETEATIADGVAWGTIKPEKAEALLRSIKQQQMQSGGEVPRQA